MGCASAGQVQAVASGQAVLQVLQAVAVDLGALHVCQSGPDDDHVAAGGPVGSKGHRAVQRLVYEWHEPRIYPTLGVFEPVSVFAATR